MSPSSSNLLMLEVPCDRHAPALVRKAVAEVPEVDSTVTDGVLVASELVTNAVLHSGCEEDGERRLEICAGVRRGRLWISVHDRGSPGLREGHLKDSDFALWGLRIIERCSQRWGCDSPDGYRVWAELALRA